MASGAQSADAVGGGALRRSPAARVAGESGRTVGRACVVSRLDRRFPGKGLMQTKSPAGCLGGAPLCEDLLGVTTCDAGMDCSIFGTELLDDVCG